MRKVVAVSLNGETYNLTRSTANGHIVDALRLSSAAVEAVFAQQQASTAPQAAADGQVLRFEAIMPHGDSRAVGGSASAERAGALGSLGH